MGALINDTTVLYWKFPWTSFLSGFDGIVDYPKEGEGVFKL
jgi:hypothetical protein